MSDDAVGADLGALPNEGVIRDDRLLANDGARHDDCGGADRGSLLDPQGRRGVARRGREDAEDRRFPEDRAILDRAPVPQHRPGVDYDVRPEVERGTELHARPEHQTRREVRWSEIPSDQVADRHLAEPV